MALSSTPYPPPRDKHFNKRSDTRAKSRLSLSVAVFLILILLLATQIHWNIQSHLFLSVPSSELQEDNDTNYANNANSTSATSPPKASINRKPTLVIIGTARNNAPYLSRLRQDLFQATEPHFHLQGMIFFENDSQDDTVAQLQAWNQHYPVAVLSQSHIKGSRTVVLAHARNTLLRALAHFQTLSNHTNGTTATATTTTTTTAVAPKTWDYVLNVDLDEVNYHLRGVNECLKLPEDWAVCCTNNYRVYYDLWALRTRDDWVDCDIRADCFTCNNDTTWNDTECQVQTNKDLEQRFRHIPASAPPIQVNSCFGGAALMAYRKIQHVPLNSYSGTLVEPDTNKTRAICEHVSFHQQVQEQGGGIYIQPKMLNAGTRWKVKRHYHEINASLWDSSLKQYYRGFDRDNLHVHYKEESL